MNTLSSMRELRFHLQLNRDEALLYYQGLVSTLVVISESGQTLSFPAQHIRPFVDATGVHGYFKIRFDQNNKLIDLQRIRA